MFGQKPGAGSTLANAYYSLTPDLSAWSNGFYKENKYYNISNMSDVEAKKTEIRAQIDAEDLGTSSTIWPIGVFFTYNNGSAFVKDMTGGNGGTTVGEQLLSHFPGKTSTSELVYGTDYKAVMYENLYWLNVWQQKVDEGSDPQEIWTRTFYTIKFPVTAKIDTNSLGQNNAEYYSTLGAAVAAASASTTEIVLNENETLADNVTIPDGVKLVVSEGVTLTISEGKKLILGDDASIEKAGEIVAAADSIEQNGESIFNTVIINGVPTENVIAGSEYSVPENPSPRMGYTFGGWIVTDEDHQDITVTDGKFIMPAKDVSISASWTPIEYSFVLGENSVYNHEDGGLVFKLNGEISLFETILVDGAEVAFSHYTVQAGSTIITLSDQFLKTLAAGEHNLTVIYANGSTPQTVFTVNEAKAPDTGILAADSDGASAKVSVLGGIFVTSMLAGAAMLVSKTLKKSKR